MLTLTQLNQRIEQLETEEYSAINTRLDTWYAMLHWMYWIHSLNSDDYHKHFEELPAGHSVRVARGKLTWFTVHFANALPDVTWKSEKAELCFAAWIEQGIEEGYSENALSTETAMNDALQFVTACLMDGTLNFYDELKKQEQENWAKKLEFRRLAHEGRLSEEAEEWLRINDSAFLENLTAKKQTEVKPEVKPITTQAIPQALPEAIPPQEIIQPVADGPVRLKYIGGWRGFNITTIDGIRAIEPGDTVTVPPFVWANIQSGVMPKSWWVKL